MAALFQIGAGELITISQFGPQLALSPEAVEWLLEQPIDDQEHGILVMSDMRSEPSLRRFTMLSGQPVNFLVALRLMVGESPTDILLVIADDADRAGLSAAQKYVLLSLALQPLQIEDSEKASALVGAASVESARAERLRLLESVVVNANDAILITEAEPIDQPGPRIVYCNAAFTRTTGYAEAEILGLTPRILQSSHVDRASLDRLRLALETWKPVEVELLNVSKDGTEFWVELSIVPVANEQGWYTHWVSVQRDITHRRVADEIATQAKITEVEKRALQTEINDRKLIEEQLYFAAYHDDLTRLRNRAYLMDRLTTLLDGTSSETKMSDQARSPTQCSILFLDLDRFKLVNDSLGHRAGDLLLMEVARRLRSVVRASDTLARLGGDEFAILIEGPESNMDAVLVAERLMEALSRPVSLGQEEVFAACSIGIAHANGQYTTPEELLRDADIAMYASKKGGASGYVTYTPNMHVGAVDALALQTDIRRALTRSEFLLVYQPIYSASSGKLIGVEALIRWAHPTRGLLSPDVFIPMAEEIGIIRDIDRWVMHEGCRQLRRWQLRYPALSIHLSINVSGDELREADFISELQLVLSDNELNGPQLQLEITESVFLTQPEFVGRILEEIRAIGVRIALDDFGTGYSSLGYLDRYQIDTLKIDRSFVARMLRQSRAMAIMEGIVRLGSALQLEIVAEGVETEEQLVMLRSLGCSNVQGYLLGRPMSAEAITVIIRDQTGHTRPATLHSV